MVFIRAAKVQTPFGAHNPQFWVKRAPFSPERYPHVAMNGEWAGRNCPPSGGNAHRSGFRLFAKGRMSLREGTFVSSGRDERLLAMGHLLLAVPKRTEVTCRGESR